MESIIFYIALFVHLTSLVMGFGSVMVVDTFGLLWLAKKRTLVQVNQVADVTQRLIWLGWSGLVLSGLVLITSKGYVDNMTKIKLFFVFMLGLNGIFLHLVKKTIEKYEKQNAVPAIVKFRIAMTTTISQMGWWGAMFIGFIHRHWKHTIQWPPHPWIVMLGIAAVLFIVWRIGEAVFKNNDQRT